MSRDGLVKGQLVGSYTDNSSLSTHRQGAQKEAK